MNRNTNLIYKKSFWGIIFTTILLCFLWENMSPEFNKLRSKISCLEAYNADLEEMVDQLKSKINTDLDPDIDDIKSRLEDIESKLHIN